MPGDIKDIKLLFKNSILSESLSLAEAGIDKSVKITVVFEQNNNSFRDNSER